VAAVAAIQATPADVQQQFRLWPKSALSIFQYADCDAPAVIGDGAAAAALDALVLARAKAEDDAVLNAEAHRVDFAHRVDKTRMLQCLHTGELRAQIALQPQKPAHTAFFLFLQSLPKPVRDNVQVEWADSAHTDQWNWHWADSVPSSVYTECHLTSMLLGMDASGAEIRRIEDREYDGWDP
jgi:hypothetical protein